ncbi:hypothetical protein [Rhodovulum sulfidophilum]|uniref:hypothetical protein n=1 Tax=Rhodovulum sulfidophilum TaxID=35806 RepID=UPI00192189F7|nr:hypothetical protein [Rhodovulum sulfidophilum]MBL3560417.1 hypothetical protein [Rhodovulum sulfidophilum]
MTAIVTPEETDQSDDQSASVDLSVAFFCCVLMLLVFVSFNLTETPERPPAASLGQPTLNTTAIPPAWDPLLKRGSWAILTETALTLLDLSPILEQVEAGSNGLLSESGGVSWRPQRNHAAARAFRLDLGIDPRQVPLSWKMTVVGLDQEEQPECIAPLRLLTVLVPDDLPDLSSFLVYADRCDLVYRFEVLDPPTGNSSVIRFTIALTTGSYSRERVFR